MHGDRSPSTRQTASGSPEGYSARAGRRRPRAHGPRRRHPGGLQPARALAERGYLGLTYNRRGVCGASGRACSEGSTTMRAVGRTSWVRPVRSLEGCDDGGLDRREHRRDGIALCRCHAPGPAGGADRDRWRQSRERLRLLARAARGLAGAKLFVSAADDVYGGADGAREWYGWAREAKQLEILPGAAHGTDMLRTDEPTARPLIRLVLRFLTRSVL